MRVDPVAKLREILSAIDDYDGDLCAADFNKRYPRIAYRINNAVCAERELYQLLMRRVAEYLVFGGKAMPFPKTAEEFKRAGYRFKDTSQCKFPKCHATIQWVETPKGRMMPLDVVTLEPHWATCKAYQKPEAPAKTD